MANDFIPARILECGAGSAALNLEARGMRRTPALGQKGLRNLVNVLEEFARGRRALNRGSIGSMHAELIQRARSSYFPLEPFIATREKPCHGRFDGNLAATSTAQECGGIFDVFALRASMRTVRLVEGAHRQSAQCRSRTGPWPRSGRRTRLTFRHHAPPSQRSRGRRIHALTPAVVTEYAVGTDVRIRCDARRPTRRSDD